MPGPLAGALVSGGAELLSTAVNALFQGSANKKQRQWQEKMYGRQRADALADWDRNNQYNSPASQMQRYKAAGLNPNLIYGTGTASAGDASPVRSSSPGSYHPDAPKIDIGGAVQNALSTFYDMQVKQAQIENLHANNELIHSQVTKNQSQAHSYDANVPYLNSKTGLVDQMFDYRTDFNPIALDQARANLRKTNVFTDVEIARNEREQAMLSPNLKIAAQRVINMRMDVIRQQMENEVDSNRINLLRGQLQFLAVQAAKINSETDLNLSELKYREQKGQSWHDSWLQRFLGNMGSSLNEARDLFDRSHPSFQKNMENYIKRKQDSIHH